MIFKNDGFDCFVDCFAFSDYTFNKCGAKVRP